jgi:phospholipid N-methyltransferase
VAVYNGVAVKEPTIVGDVVVYPDQKRPNVDALRAVCRPGDAVACVGGGAGVTSTHAARLVGRDGQVTVYEAVPDIAEKLRETYALNHVDDVVTVVNAIVGEAGKLDADLGDADVRVVDPESLSDVDVLDLDCEGAEFAILETLLVCRPADLPQAVVVETHPEFGAPTAAVTDLVERLGYDVVASKPDAEDGAVLTCVRGAGGE